MRIALLLPITLKNLQHLFPNVQLPKGYEYPLFVPMVYFYLKQGHEVVICTENFQSLRSHTYYGKNITLFVAGTIPRAKIRAALNFEFEIWQMVQFLKSHPCDIYHAHWEYEFARTVLRVDSNKALITIHDWPDKINASLHDFYWNRRCAMARKSLKQGIYFTAVSPYMFELMSSHYSNKDVKIIPNMIEMSQIDCDTCNQKKFRTSNRVIVAINSGFSCLKNVVMLMKAFPEILKVMPDIKLRLIGNGYGKGEQAEKWALAHGLAENIEFIGAVVHEKVLNYLKSADLFVHPSREESFGMVLIEAMRSCTPVVAGQSSGAVPWILKDGECGKLVNVEDFNDIAAGVLEVLGDQSKWEAYCKAGTYRALEFGVEQICEQYLQRYKEVLNMKGGNLI